MEVIASESTAAGNAELFMSKCSDSFEPFWYPKISLKDNHFLYNFEGFWYPPRFLEATKSIQSNFVARDDDIILTSSIKTGSTWLKALVYCIMHKGTKLSDDPLTKNHPVVLVPTLEIRTFVSDPNPDLSSLLSPRIFHTHMPYVTLPDSIKNSSCKIVYIVRNPKDTFVSMWYFLNRITEVPVESLFEGFCQGIHNFGPFFEHVLEYWNESLKAPQKILFFEVYEDLKKDPNGEVKKLATFLGRQIHDEKEIDEVIRRCSFERLKNLEVKKSGFVPSTVMPNNAYFRVGVVGDWKNVLTPEMEEKLDQITKLKLAG